MNERIQELWSQAGGHYNSGNQHTWPQYTIDDPAKFAELIVRECIDIAQDRAAFDGFPPNDVNIVIDEIKEHFEVESTSIKVGSRVKVVSGFNVGAKGTVSYIEPTGRMWVMRDGASTDVFYTPDEVVRIEQ